MAAVPTPSTSQVNKAGDALRQFFFSQPRLRDADALERVSTALDVLTIWRAAHAVPLQSATMGLRSRVATAQCRQLEVSQRLKRIPTILNKLNREPGMMLGRMADIGGCRAVLRDIDEVRRVQQRYEDSGIVRRVRDYIDEPKPDGYRAVHVIVEYRGRKIEVQLRTQVMHEWAYTVEGMNSRFGLDVKSGKGPAAVSEWFQAVSQAMAMEESGMPVSAELLERVATLREAALPYLRLRGDRS